jgi:hypothetical protein
MKKLAALFIIVFAITVSAQFKESGIPNTNVKDGIITQNYSGGLFGFINPNNFHMNHSFNLSYSAMGDHGLSLGVYTNSMMYKFNDQLNVQLDASLVHSPYSTFGENFQNNINGLYISKAALNFMPTKDLFISIQYRQLPYNFYNPYGGYGSRSFFERDSFWGR